MCGGDGRGGGVKEMEKDIGRGRGLKEKYRRWAGGGC